MFGNTYFSKPRNSKEIDAFLNWPKNATTLVQPPLLHYVIRSATYNVSLCDVTRGTVRCPLRRHSRWRRRQPGGTAKLVHQNEPYPRNK
jgi:hypothetical protein